MRSLCRYEDNSEDAWVLARKIFSGESSGGFSEKALDEIFGEDSHLTPVTILARLTYKQAAAKVNAWLKDVQDFKVGDEIYCIEDSYTAIVTAVTGDYMYIMDSEGSCEHVYRKNGNYRKTGRSFECNLKAILDHIGEEE